MSSALPPPSSQRWAPDHWAAPPAAHEVRACQWTMRRLRSRGWLRAAGAQQPSSPCEGRCSLCSPRASRKSRTWPPRGRCAVAGPPPRRPCCCRRRRPSEWRCQQKRQGRAARSPLCEVELWVGGCGWVCVCFEEALFGLLVGCWRARGVRLISCCCLCGPK
jgi:hypothetical protein